jgi:hypothetical protein
MSSLLTTGAEDLLAADLDYEGVLLLRPTRTRCGC